MIAVESLLLMSFVVGSVLFLVMIAVEKFPQNVHPSCFDWHHVTTYPGFKRSIDILVLSLGIFTEKYLSLRLTTLYGPL